ncbi:MAG: MauE/DoxX family redox-associated membrane protein [Lysobacterales bacterium]
MDIDPLIAFLLLGTIALLFTVSAFHKLSAPRHFLAVVADYQLVPPALHRPLGVALVVGELSVVILALTGNSNYALKLASVLLAAYTLGIAINLLRGRRDIDCGCAGPAATQTLSEWLVVRNSILLLIALIAQVPSMVRPFAAADWATLSVGLLAASGLYVAANTLIANHLRLTSDRESRLWKTR